MRITGFLILFSVTLFSCTNKYKVEDQLYASLDETFKLNGLNLEKTLDTLEVLHLKNGLLISGSNADYRNYYQRTVDGGQALILRDDYVLYLKEQLNKHPLNISDGKKKIDKNTLDKSKFGQILVHIENSVQETGQITFMTISNAYLEVLESADFEHPFYKANVLLQLHIGIVHEYLKNDEKYIRKMPAYSTL